MGFLDKIKSAANQIKEENRNFGTTTKRINTPSTFYGYINKPASPIFKMNPSDDFCKGSYISIENGKGVIYGSAQDDYVFGRDDIKSFSCTGKTYTITRNNQKEFVDVYIIEFQDGKMAVADLLSSKIGLFRTVFGL